jgi:magnesium-transporting ATPase (P-type)
MGEVGPSERRISSFLFIIILVSIGLSLVAFYQAVIAYESGEFDLVVWFVLIGFMGVALLIYMLLQTRKRTFKLPIQAQRVATTILCQKCGFKNIRDFERGDYVFKDTEECPKCNEKMMIASIYREAEGKGKKD